MSADVKIFQNWLKEGDIKELDPAFTPNDWSHNPLPDYREIGVFLHFYESGRYREAEYVGVVSRKFCQKAKISGQEFIQFIEANPGFDVYFINPSPQYAYYSFNVWEQGEASHPGIIELAQKLIDATGYSISIPGMGRNDHDTLAYCNYWVGNSKFWNTYMGFVTPLVETIEQRMAPEERARYFAATDYVKHPVKEAPMFPFIFERMFSTFLLVNETMSSCPYPHTRKEIWRACRYEGERKIVEHFSDIIDEWDRKKMYDDERRTVFSGLVSLLHLTLRLHVQVNGPIFSL
ncbi:MAG: hypothetical protein ACLQPD_20540 [Desulfomonilaceae bacterium]